MRPTSPRFLRSLPPSPSHSLRVLGLVAATAIAVAACASSSGASWTYAPTAPATPVPSGQASASAGASGGSAGASGSPTTGSQAPGGSGATGSGAPGGGSGNPAASGAATGTTLSLTAQNIAYDKQTLQAPANTAFTISFNNMDQGVPHNVSIHKDSPTGQEIFKGDIITGPAQTSYTIPALAPGTYGFVCSVHPNMTGTLTVQ